MPLELDQRKPISHNAISCVFVGSRGNFAVEFAQTNMHYCAGEAARIRKVFP